MVRTRNLSLTRRIIATIDRSGAYNLNRLSNIISRGNGSLPGLLGIMNSTLFNWLFSTRFYDYEIKPVYLRTAPLGDTTNRDLIDAVDRMLLVQQLKVNSRTPVEATKCQREIVALEKRIDSIVFDLYGLSDREIGVVDDPGRRDGPL